jgi:pilus assembly protein CpaB
MNRTRLLMIGVLALALGFLASVYVYKNLQSKSGGGADAGADVMVAADDLQVGARVDEHDIKVIRIPAADLPPGAPRKRSEVIGHGVIVPISKGEFILPNRLAGENAGSGLPSLIPPGMRAVSVRVNEVVSVAGFVTPGTRVDVLLTGSTRHHRRAGDHHRSAERRWCWPPATLWNALPPAKPRIRRSSRWRFRPTMPSASPSPVLEGKIQLALRNPLDTRQDEVPFPIPEVSIREAAGSHRPVVHHTVVKKETPPPAPPPAGISIEVYQGDKKPEIVKCSEDNCGTN